MRLSIGAAQFGSNYGATNIYGKPTEEEVRKIIEYAGESNIKDIDTASTYGNSEELIGKLCDSNWRITSKLRSIPETIEDKTNWISDEITKSIKRLKRNSIDTLLIHNSKDFMGEKGKEVIKVLNKEKAKGRVNNVGLSLYDYSIFKEDNIVKQIDKIQVPFNVFDRRLVEKDIQNKISENNISVEVRSIFLQGVLLQDKIDRNIYFDKWPGAFEELDKIKDRTEKISYCIEYIKNYSFIDKVIIGFQRLDELKQVCTQFNREKSRGKSMYREVNYTDRDLINPSQWELK